MKQIGVNCFGLNDLLHSDFEGTCTRLKEIGFSSIEPMIVFPKAMGMPSEAMASRLQMAGQDGAFWVEPIAKERIASLRAMGFAVEGVHLGLAGMAPGGIDAILPHAARFAAENDLKYLVHSPQKKTVEEIQKDVPAFRKGMELMKEQGTELIFHCHYHEFAEDHGDTPFAYLLRQVPDLRVELDVGWVHYARVDVPRLMEEYRERIAILHLKDIVPGAAAIGNKDVFTAIGEGSIPLRQIMKQAEELSLSYTGFVIDQDASLEDMMKDLAVGYHNIQTAAGNS